MASDDTEFAAIRSRLYVLPPDEFVAARDAEARRAPAVLARRIRELRRPTLSAWLVNLLAAHRGAEVAELLSIGQRLRDAQRSLVGQELRDLSTRRQAVITGLMDAVRELASEHGRTPRDDTVWEAETTLRAALADPDLAEQVRAGALVKAVEYSGLGLAPDDSAPSEPGAAVPRTPRAKLRVIPGGRGPEPAAPRPGPDAETATRTALQEAQRELEQAVTVERETGRRLRELLGELEDLRVRERRLRAQMAELERAHRRAQRRRQAAEQGVARARQRLRQPEAP